MIKEFMHKQFFLRFIKMLTVLLLLVVVTSFFAPHNHGLGYIYLNTKQIAYLEALRQDNQNFLESRMTNTAGGIHTNYLDTDSAAGDLASGRDILSETQGLAMLYYARIGDKEKFEKSYEYVKTHLASTGFISWRQYADGTVSPVNALIDDLRIIKALFLAEQAFKNPVYHNDALDYASFLLDENSVDYTLRSYYSVDEDEAGPDISLCYLDLSTIKLLAEEIPEYKIIYENALPILKGGLISQHFPLYYNGYNYNDGSYYSHPLNTTEAMFTVLHLAEQGEQLPETIEWLRKRVATNTLYTRYSADTGLAMETYVSSASYAVCAMIFYQLGDLDYYFLSIEKMNAMLVKDENTIFKGSYGLLNGDDVYAFDNLCALLAYSYALK